MNPEELQTAAKNIIDMIISPHTRDVGMLYLNQDHIVPTINDLAHEMFGEMEELAGMNWLELVQQTELNLSGRGLKTLPLSIGNLTNLKVLCLHYNELRQIPESVGKLTNLRELYLHRNELRKIPESISSLTNLEYMCLVENTLKKLPNDIGNLINLEVLDLRNNQLKHLPESFEKLIKLKKIGLTGSGIFETEKKRIKQVLPNIEFF